MLNVAHPRHRKNQLLFPGTSFRLLIMLSFKDLRTRVIEFRLIYPERIKFEFSGRITWLLSAIVIIMSGILLLLTICGQASETYTPELLRVVHRCGSKNCRAAQFQD